jgi:ABC-type transport system involved in multi-copper enzyme maturation permease subunit
MPVFDYSYQTWRGERSGPLLRWLAIPKYTYMAFFGKKAFIWLFTMAWMQFILRVGYIYVLVNADLLDSLHIPARILPQINAFFFKNMIDVQMIFCFLLTFIVGSDLISGDLIHRAFVLYASKPISRWEYFLGKFLTLFGMLMLLTWFQTMALYVLQIAIAPKASAWRTYFWSEYAWIFPAITLYSVIISTALSLMILAASSMVKNARYAAVTLIMYVVVSSAVGGITGDILNNRNALVLSPFVSGVDLGYTLFHLPEKRLALNTFTAWAGVIGVCVVAGSILKWRLGRAARYGN